MTRKVTWSLVLLLFAGSSVSAQEWAQKMFKIKSHSFGTLARDSKAVFEFELTNLYKEDVHIAAVRTSCGCTILSIKNDKRTLKTWEKGAIVATFNTRSFLGHRSATVTVTIDKPYYAEVQLRIDGNIRSDVVFNPGSINFGEINQGEPAQQKATVSYAGRSDWKIVDVRSASDHIEVELVNERRESGRVNYDMIVRLKKNAPAGYINEQLFIVTNDSQTTNISLTLEGRIVSPLTLSPASLFLGVVQPGQKVQRQLVLRGKMPFKITRIDCPDQCFEFKPSDESRALHLIPITFTAGPKPSKIEQRITIETDMGMTASCVVTASVQIRKTESGSP